MAKKQPPPEPAEPAPGGDEYTVVARRYRPQQFADLVGQEHVARALVNALQSNRVAHAYLFTGARGVGKTSTARILAKALNCDQGPTPTPCDRCPSCKAVAAGEDIDVLEIDGASNRGIDEVRAIRQNVQTRPGRSRYKIYIIDEVHMLTPPAFNALLKTLEEPPPHVKFLFATTEVQKIPVTILSRCQRFDFAGIAAVRIMERLKQVVAAEKKEADDEALELVARLAGGSMRDAQSLLDQLLAFAPDRLTAEQVYHLLGTAPPDQVFALADAVLKHDAAAALAAVGRYADEGLQLGDLLDQLIAYWRDLMLVNCAGPDVAGLQTPPAHRDALGEQAKAVKLDAILAGLDILTTTKARMRTSNHGLVLVQMAVVRLARLDDLLSVGQLVQALSQPGAIAPRSTGGPRPADLPEAKKKTGSLNGNGPLNGHPAPTNGTPVPAGPTALTPETLPQIWAEVLAQVGGTLALSLGKAGIPAILGPKALVAVFAAEYNFHYERCGDSTTAAKIEAALQRITGQPWSLKVELAPVAAARPGVAPAARPLQTRDAVLKDPLIQRAVEVFGASLLRQDPGFGQTPANPPTPPAGGRDHQEN